MVGFVWWYEMPIGMVGIGEDGGGISHVLLPHEKGPTGYERKETPLIAKAHSQLAEYFAGTRQAFDLALNARGTAFQRAVWAALLEIPYGVTCSYKDVAMRIGNPNASRAVGMANNRNPIAIIVPCHRVVGADGRLVGYGGGLHIKTFLLELEGRVKK